MSADGAPDCNEGTLPVKLYKLLQQLIHNTVSQMIDDTHWQKIVWWIIHQSRICKTISLVIIANSAKGGANTIELYHYSHPIYNFALNKYQRMVMELSAEAGIFGKKHYSDV